MISGESRFGTFFLPGPTEVHPEVLQAMTRPMMPHRGRDFESLFARIQDGLRPVFRTERPVYVSSSSATGLMEASLRCTPPGPVLSLVNGAFSDRYARIASACGHLTAIHAVPHGSAFDVAEVESLLRAGAAGSGEPFVAVTVVHSETSTGVLCDVASIAGAARRHGAMSLVDGVTSVAGAPVEPDGWQLDFVLTGSQKALALPPGLALGVASQGYVDRAASAESRGVYLDVVEFDQFAAKNQTPNTPALPLLYALDAQLARILREGIEARWERHTAMAERTCRWVEETSAALGVAMGILAPDGARSPTVTALTMPPGIDGRLVVKAVARRGYVIGGGYGTLAERSIRVGHMGDHTVGTLEGCLGGVAEALREML
jgi:aspartate aminotransferase-like enzyme